MKFREWMGGWGREMAALWLWSALVWLPVPVGAGQEITAAVLRDFPPLYQTDSQGRPAGFAIDILEQVAQKANWQLQYLVVENWDDAVAAVRERRADLAPAVAVTEKWAREFLFSDPTEAIPVACFVRQGSQAVRGCDDLEGRMVAVVQQGAAHQFLDKKDNIQLIPTINLETALVKLLSGEVDVLAAPQPVVQKKALALDLAHTIKPVGQPLLELKRAMLLRKEMASLLPVINPILQDYLQSSHYLAAYRHYYGSADSPWSPLLLAWWGAGAGLLLVFFWALRKFSVVTRLRRWRNTPQEVISLQATILYYLHNKVTAWIILGISLVVTVVGWHITNLSVENRSNDRFAYKVEESSLEIAKRMREYEQVLRGGVGLFNASGQVSRQDWRRYVDTLQIETYWPGIQGIGFSLMVAPGDKEAHIRQVRAQGFPDYTIRPEGERWQYSAIIFLEPFKDRNLRAFGYDMYSETVRRAAMDQARDSGAPTVSGRVTLVQETVRDVQAGFLMYLPVYRSALPTTTVEERRAGLFGFVYSPFRIGDLMRGILGHGEPDLDFEVFDGSEPEGDHLLYASFDTAAKKHVQASPRYRATRFIQVPGRTWMARFQSRQKFEQEMASNQPLLVASLGMIVDLLLFIIVWSLSGRQEQIEKKAMHIGQELSKAQARYRQMVENLKDVIYQTDAQGRWTFLNPAWEEISGHGVQDSLGKPLLDYICPDDHPRILELFHGLLDDHWDHFRQEVCGLHRSGEQLWLEVYAGVQRDEQGQAAGAFGMLRDVSARKKVEVATQQARQAAESANRAKSEFLANMSHELRTPLNSLLILAKLLANESNLTADQAESARVIHESGSDLLRLINDILDLSKVEAGRMELVAEEMAFRHFLEIIEKQFHPVAESRGVVWTRGADSALPETLTTDWQKVTQIVRNLLANAFKFTENGTVSLFIRPHGPSESALAFVVTDSGIGIPEDKQEMIFETFQQLDGATSRKYGGTGLGLAISQRLARLLGGEIHVESRLGQGSAFTLVLPRMFPFPAQVQTPLSKVVAGREKEFHDPRLVLLLVDDDPRNRYAIGKILQGRVGEILTAADGVEALCRLAERPDIQLVLMDIMMPHMDGYQAMAEIRRQHRFVRLPIIALTAKAMPGDRERCLEAGANDYLSKPVQVEQLFATMKNLSTSSEGKGFGGKTARQEEWPPVSPVVPLLTHDGHPATLLVVENDVKQAFSLARTLHPRVEQVLVATDEDKAMKQLAGQSRVDVVLLDITLADTLGRIARMDHPPAILALTDPITPAEESLCRAAGADAILTKPVVLEHLWPLLEQLLNKDGNKG